MMSFSQQLEVYKQSRREAAPEHVVKQLEQSVIDLENSGHLEKCLCTNDYIPDFSIKNCHGGDSVSIKNLLKKSSFLVISFIRGEWCGFDIKELLELQKRLPELNELGVSVVAIGPAKPEFLQSTLEDHNLQFDILHDYKHKVSDLFGLTYIMPQEIRDIYEASGIDIALWNNIDLDSWRVNITEWNDDDSYKISIPATYLVDTNGKIILDYVTFDYTTRLDPLDIIAKLREFQ